MSAVIPGVLHKLYIDADGDIASPTWVEYGEIQGGGLTGPKDEMEIKERSILDTLVMTGHKTRTVSLTATRRPGNTNYDLLQVAYETGAKVGIAMMTGPIATTGSRGYQAEMYVTSFDDDQAHESTSVSITLKPAADYVTPPAYVTVSSGG